MSEQSTQLTTDEMAGHDLIAQERRRQIWQEGWTPGHDDEHTGDELAKAAACYANPIIETDDSGVPFEWPWDKKWWKPSAHDRIRELVKAGALIAAEIDRLQRKEKKGMKKMTEHKQRKLDAEEREECLKAAIAIFKLPTWASLISPEGSKWVRVYELLDNMSMYGTSDGKPWVEPKPEPVVPTDEWVNECYKKTGEWPEVQVKYARCHSWESRRLIRVLPSGDMRFVTISNNGSVTNWRYCQLAQGESMRD